MNWNTWIEFCNAYKRHGSAVAGGSTLFSVVTFIVPGPSLLAKVGIVIALFFLPALVVTILTLWDLWTSARRMQVSPRVRRSFATQSERAPLLLILDSSPLFGADLIVTVYLHEVHEDVSFERLIGVGRVSNVQSDGMIQVVILAREPAHKEVWASIERNEPATLKQLLVKPSAPAESLAMLMVELEMRRELIND